MPFAGRGEASVAAARVSASVPGREPKFGAGAASPSGAGVPWTAGAPSGPCGGDTGAALSGGSALLGSGRMGRGGRPEARLGRGGSGGRDKGRGGSGGRAAGGAAFKPGAVVVGIGGWGAGGSVAVACERGG